MRGTIEERMNNYLKEMDGCLIWMGAQSPEGFGLITINSRVKKRAQWSAYNIWVAPINKATIIKQTCNNRLCCKREHLYIANPEMSLSKLNGIRRGSHHHLSKLNEEQVKLIRYKWSTLKKSQSALAIEFKVSQGIIQRIISDKTWKHLTESK